MISPTTTLPPMTKLPNAAMTWPAWPEPRIRRVLVTFRPSRNSVISSSRLGNTLNSIGSCVLMVIMSVTMDSPKLTASSASSRNGGSGSTSSATITITPTASTVSALDDSRRFAALAALLLAGVSPRPPPPGP